LLLRGANLKEVIVLKKQKGFTLIELLIVVAIIGIIAAIAIPNLLNAIDRGKQKRTMADLRSVGTAVEEYAIDNSFYPNVASESDIVGSNLETSVEPIYIRNVPVEDGWGWNMRYVSDTTMYTCGSLAKDGSSGGSLTLDGSGGQMTDFDCDIIFSGGSFIQWPEGTQSD
jgi:general secretion pathway protein G